MTHTHQKKSVRFLSVLAACLAAHCVISLLVTKWIYDGLFTRYDEPVTARVTEQVSPSPVSFPSGESTLTGRLYDGSEDSLIVYVQGINSRMDSHIPVINSLLACGDVFIFDPTGAGESGGDGGIGFSQILLDLHAALDHIENSFQYEDIILFGHSRGGFAVCCAASARQDVDAVVSINAPNSAMDAVMAPMAEAAGWIVYSNWPFLWLYQAMLFDGKTVSVEASDCIAQVQIPVLIVHAQEDTTVPMHTYSVYSHREQVTGGNVRFLSQPGGHTSLLFGADETSANEDLMSTVKNFIEER